MMVILVSAALVSFLLCLAAGRYAGWYGVVVPIALVVPFGAGEPDAIPFIVVSGLVAGLGFFTGLRRRLLLRVGTDAVPRR
jgi:hypothetical protein